MKFLLDLLKVPPIHDISTDTVDPPPLIAAKQDRKAYHHSVDYPGEPVAALQRRAWPDIASVQLSVPPDQAFRLALQQVRKQGWHILNQDTNAGIIEAVAVTRLLRFRDDIVIRIRARDGGSRLDARSASRLGVSDFGTNARRIGSFLAAMQQEL